MEPLVLVLLVLAGMVALYGVLAHNRFVRQEHLVEQAWRQVEGELERRQRLVPALVEAVQTYTAHDTRALQKALEGARAASGPAEVGPAETELTTVLHRLPSGPYERLQEQLAETEDRIAAARRFYDSNVRALAVRRETFPSSLIARATGVVEPDPLELP